MINKNKLEKKKKKILKKRKKPKYLRTKLIKKLNLKKYQKWKI